MYQKSSLACNFEFGNYQDPFGDQDDGYYHRGDLRVAISRGNPSEHRVTILQKQRFLILQLL